MKILHISTSAKGGAFTGTYRLHKALLSIGINSKILVYDQHPEISLEEVYSIPYVNHNNIVYKILNKIGIHLTSHYRWLKMTETQAGEYECISRSFADYDITENDLFKDADIVNLHWVADFLDYKSFFEKCSVPVVITLRDLFPFQGIFHYKADMKNNKSLSMLDGQMKSIKEIAIHNAKCKINVVGLSNWIKELSEKSTIHKDLPHTVISNCLDISSIPLLNIKDAKQLLNLPLNSFVISFVSDSIDNKRKGIRLLLNAIKKIDNKDFILITAGKGEVEFEGLNIVNLGHIPKVDLPIIYSASDLFVSSSLEEAFGNVIIEAMACGAPVIGFKAGGILDVVQPGVNGYIADDFTADSLSETIELFYSNMNSFDRKKIREYVKENYNPLKIANQYKKLYESIL